MATQPSPLISRQGPPLKYRPKLAPGSNQSTPPLSSNLKVADSSQNPTWQPDSGVDYKLIDNPDTSPMPDGLSADQQAEWQYQNPSKIYQYAPAIFPGLVNSPAVQNSSSGPRLGASPNISSQPVLRPNQPIPSQPAYQASRQLPNQSLPVQSMQQTQWNTPTPQMASGPSKYSQYNAQNTGASQPSTSAPQAPATQPAAPTPQSSWDPSSQYSQAGSSGYNDASSYKPTNNTVKGYARGGVVGNSRQPLTASDIAAQPPSSPVDQQATPAPPSVNAGNNPYSAGSSNPFNSRDVYNQNQQMGQDQFQQGQDWKNNYGQLGDYYDQQEATAGDKYNTQLDQFAAGNGGFTQDQQNNIVQNGAYGAIQADQQNNFLTPSEQAGIQGNPYAAKDLFSGQAQGLTDIAAGENANLQNAANTGAAQGDNVVNQFGQTVNSSINPANLQLSAGYKSGIDSALQLGQSQLTSAQNNPALTPTASYLKQAGMSDQEVQDTSEAAARSVGAQYGATKDELIQNARASGEGSPLAIASAESGLDRSSAADQSDALTQARLGARQQQINAATGIQNTQLNAGQYQAGLGSQNALAEQNANISANTTAEQLRLAANSNLTNTQLQAGQTLASLGLQNNSTNTQNKMYAFQTGAQAGLSTGEYNATTATNLTQQAESNAQARAAQVATNRQGVNQSNEAANTNIAGQLSNQYLAAYGPGVQGKQLALTGQGNQQQYYGGQANAQGQLALGGWQDANQGQQNAASNYANWGENQQTTAGVTGAINNIATVAKAVTGGKAKGGLITQHQTIEVGEHDRPEAILPLDPATPPEKRNTWEKLGVQLGHRLGIHSNPDSFIGHSDHLPKLPKTHFATGGLISFDPSNPFTTDERDLSRAEDPFASVGGNGYARGGVVGGIKPSHAGMLHENMGIPLGQKIPLSSLEAEKRKAMASGNPAIVKRATFAENARHWAH